MNTASKDYGSLSDVAAMALIIACSAPVVRPDNAQHALVPWEAVDELRRMFDARGLDWKKLKREKRL